MYFQKPGKKSEKTYKKFRKPGENFQKSFGHPVYRKQLSKQVCYYTVSLDYYQHRRYKNYFNGNNYKILKILSQD